MSETQDQKSFFKRHWEGYKEFWAERFSFLENYSRVLNPEKPLPHWNSSVVEDFIASDPVHGPALKTAREAAQFGAAGAVLGAVTTAGYCWKYSRSAHGAALAFGFGAVTGSCFGLEIANHWFQLYRLDTMAAQMKFYDWLQNRASVDGLKLDKL